MIFINYDTLLFSSLSNQQTALMSASKPSCLNAVNVCNVSDVNLRINLTVSKAETSSFLVHEVLISPNESMNLLSLGNLSVFLTEGDSLFCYSNAYNQTFDCSISYSEINEEEE